MLQIKPGNYTQVHPNLTKFCVKISRSDKITERGEKLGRMSLNLAQLIVEAGFDSKAGYWMKRPKVTASLAFPRASRRMSISSLSAKPISLTFKVIVLELSAVERRWFGQNVSKPD